LEEIIVGNATNARFPYADVSTHNTEFAGTEFSQIPRGPFPEQVVEETEEDLAKLVNTLEALNITVKRPVIWRHDEPLSNQLWSARGFYNYCPRDVLLVVGDRIIESPNAIRGRYHETFSYRKILLEYLDAGAKWFSAPKPMLTDALFEVPLTRPVPNDLEPVFDAANVLRFGQDLVYLISSTGNEYGARWLQTVLADSFRVHTCEFKYHGSHIDTSIVALRPGLLLCNPERVSKEMLPLFLRKWEIIFCPPLTDPYDRTDAYLRSCLGSKWMGMNILSVRPDLVIVDKHQGALIRLLERYQIEAIPLELRHARMLGGGFHCVTADIRRRADS
jgi:N-dimethylarginine dimethylaminohydrolase